MKSLKGSKRGSLEDAVLIGLFLAVIAIFAYPLVNSFSLINADIQANPDIADDAKGISSDFNTDLPNILEGIFLLLLVGGYLGTFILAFFIDTQPAFFVIAAIFMTSMVLVLPMVANAYDSVTNGQFSEVTTQFTIIPFVMQNYLQITLVMWALIILGIYAKRAAFK